eukprot:TRINITY_DN7167_c0_g2_i4.p1 TRINITY_DN7167_c0_g2~~TRINITY_DN7167_c0_g2_i4.p1  ORF type:complete len:278 (+),score=37.26 TRINITY_DN7167_c0_g2_i4:192-1025(+)
MGVSDIIINDDDQSYAPRADEPPYQFAELFMGLLSQVAVLAIVFGGVVPFIPQYLKIRRTRSAEGFSTLVLCSLLFAYLLRVFFWFGHPFETPLLLQSGIMIVALLMVQHACVTAEPTRLTPVPIHFSIKNLSMETFWQWTSFHDYLQAVAWFVFVYAALTYLLHNISLFVELTGLMSLLLEASLGIPQFLSNYRQESTQGMSIAMVVCWLSGDVFKTCYYVLRSAPLQFPLCGALQIMVDIAILYQVFLYSHPTPQGRHHHSQKPVGLPLKVKIEP